MQGHQSALQVLINYISQHPCEVFVAILQTRDGGKNKDVTRPGQPRPGSVPPHPTCVAPGGRVCGGSQVSCSAPALAGASPSHWLRDLSPWVSYLKLEVYGHWLGNSGVPSELAGPLAAMSALATWAGTRAGALLGGGPGRWQPRIRQQPLPVLLKTKRQRSCRHHPLVLRNLRGRGTAAQAELPSIS